MSRVMTVYKFEELSPEAQQKAIKKFQEDEAPTWSQDWEIEDITRDMHEQLKERGYVVKCLIHPRKSGSYEDPKIRWSLSSCQGDGMSWEGTVDFKILAKRLLTEEEYALAEQFFDRLSCAMSWNHGSNYCHSHTMDIDFTNECENDPPEGFLALVYENAKPVLKKLEEAIKDDVHSTADDLETDAQEELDYHQSEEFCRQELENQEHWEYTEEGDRV